VLELVEQRRAAVPEHLRRGLHDVVALERRHRDERQVGELQTRGEGADLRADRVEHRLVVVDEVHLVHAHDDVRDPQQGRDEQVPPGLLDDAVAGVDEHEREVGGRGSGHHVPRVANVAGGVGEDERPARGREMPIRHVDRDPLLALGPQTVGDQGQIELDALGSAGRGDLLEGVLEDLLGVVEQPAEQRALAVVDRARGGDPQQTPVDDRSLIEGSHQKYPSRLRSSIAEFDTRSSARVCPRSVMRVAAISRTTSSSESAVEDTAPVQVMSPTVR
jgi:hypothetical protein